MRRPTLRAILATVILLLGGCTIINRVPQQQEQTQLERRQYQQRDFDTNDVKLVMRAVLNTLQDDGFTVRNAVVDLGLISAVKEIMLTDRQRVQQENSSPAATWAEIFLAAITRGRSQQTNSSLPPRYRNIQQIEATINVSPFGNRQTRVRVSFVARVLDNEGAVVESYPVTDPDVYQTFFVKVDKGVFLEKQKF